MHNSRFYFANREQVDRFINRWDILLLILMLSLLFFLAWAGRQMALPYHLGTPLPISLDPSALPFYALRTILRMFIALTLSMIFTLIIGAWAAKSRRAEQVIIPAIDILQAVPVLSFLAITISGFVWLFPGSLLGPEFASIFVIFTSQVWNITFAFYQSLKTLPHDLCEASAIYQLSPWQRFWKLEVPFSMPSMLWNMMISMSASWFFVVISESISVAHQDIRLPGIGSYIAVAIEQGSLSAVAYAILTMVIVIFLYDQIFFRPLIAWSEKFKVEQSTDGQEYQSWLVDWMRRSILLKRFGYGLGILKDYFVNTKLFRARGPVPEKENHHLDNEQQDRLWNAIVLILMLASGALLFQFILSSLGFNEIVHVFLLGTATAIRVVILIILSSVLWIPIGVWVGLRPHIAQKIQPIIQFVAAFPANLFYPLFVIAIVRFHLSVEVWITPLMILGTQWYILFNVIAGASAIPRDLYLAANNLGLKGMLWWKRLLLPAIFPYYITGVISAAGGAWNASIVAECVSWGDTTLKATGLGEYIQTSTLSGDFPKIALGTAMMCLYVLMFNQVLWQPLYRVAQKRFNLN